MSELRITPEQLAAAIAEQAPFAKDQVPVSAMQGFLAQRIDEHNSRKGKSPKTR